MNWQDKKRIGEALGYRVEHDEIDDFYYRRGQSGDFFPGWRTEKVAWNAYQPDVIGQVIPWLRDNTHGLRLDCPDRIWWMVSTDYPMASGEYKDFSEAVCALMLAVLNAGVPA